MGGQPGHMEGVNQRGRQRVHDRHEQREVHIAGVEPDDCSEQLRPSEESTMEDVVQSIERDVDPVDEEELHGVVVVVPELALEVLLQQKLNILFIACIDDVVDP